jgi:hypothetical protein
MEAVGCCDRGRERARFQGFERSLLTVQNRDIE